MTDRRVAVVPRNRGEVLVRRRGGPDGDGPRWTLLTGPSDGDHAAAARSLLHAEPGIPGGAAELVRAGEPIRPANGDAPAADAPDGDETLVPVLLDVDSRDAAGEQRRWEWVAPPSLRSHGVAPWLWQAYEAVRPTVATVADDTAHGSTTLSVRALAVLRDEATLAAETDDPARVRAVARDLIAARPAMTAVKNRVNRVVAAAGGEVGGAAAAAVADAAHEGIERAARADGGAAANAADRLEGDRVATLSRSGTVLAALDAAEPAALLAAESRPGGEGVAVAERFATGTDVTLSTDAAFPSELVRWGADALLVGADTVLPDGSVRNKAGTYPAAAVAAREGVPVVVVTATDKISHESAVNREPWPGDPLYGGDAPVAAANPTFDVTPPACIEAFVTERGALAPDDVTAIAVEHRELAAWDEPA
jgi:translation initiation factor 2B subunit (eIF-2B alpha/beta/delta family)